MYIDIYICIIYIYITGRTRTICCEKVDHLSEILPSTFVSTSQRNQNRLPNTF